MTNYLGSGGFDPQAYMMRKLMDELFKDKTPERKAEANTMSALAGGASTEGEFQKLDKVLDDYWRRNDTYGSAIDSMEIKQKATYNNRKREFNQYKQAHIDALAMTNTDYLISSTDKESNETRRLKERIDINVKRLNEGKLTPEDEKMLRDENSSYQRQLTEEYKYGHEKGGIQNITTNDVSSWTHEKLTEELGKVNKIRDAFGYAEKGYKYNMKDSPHTSLSLARDINNYYDNLTAALGIAVETNEIPKDEILLRMIVSGDTEGVKKHSEEQRTNAAALYKVHDGNIDTLETLLSKVLAYEDKTPEEYAKYLGKVIQGQEGGAALQTLSSIPGIFETEGGIDLDYSTWANNIGEDLSREYELRKKANERHKDYTGKLYEDVGTEMSESMLKFKQEGYSLSIADPDNKPTVEEDGSLADAQEKKEIKKEKKAAVTPTLGIDLTPEGMKRKKRHEKKLEEEKMPILYTDVGYPTAKTTPEYKEKMKATRVIHPSNKSIQKLWNITKHKYLRPGGTGEDKVTYKGFAESIIKEWNKLSNKDKIEYGSFENYMIKLEESETRKQLKKRK